MSIVMYEDLPSRIRVHYDNENPEPRRFEVWMTGTPHVVIGSPSETSQRMWSRVRQFISDNRSFFIRADQIDPYGKTSLYRHGDGYGWVDVYAGIEATDEQKLAHVGSRYIWWLWRKAKPEHNRSAIGRVNALTELSEVLGLTSG